MKQPSLKISQLTLDADSLSLAIEAEVDFEHFSDFAEPFVRALDCHVRERQWGADRHQWLLDFEGSLIGLHYEFYGDICWLSCERAADFEVLVYLAGLLQPYLTQS